MEEKKEQKIIEEINKSFSLFLDNFKNKDEFTQIFLEIILKNLSIKK